MYLRRIGPDPHANGAQTVACHGRPDIWEIQGGDFAVIGQDITETAGMLPSSAICGPDERIVASCASHVKLWSWQAGHPDRI